MRRATWVIAVMPILLPGCGSEQAQVPKTTPLLPTRAITTTNSPTGGENYPKPSPVASFPVPMPTPPVPVATISPTDPIPTEALRSSPKPVQSTVVEDGGQIHTGSPAINFSLPDVRTGKAVTLRSLRGKPVFLNFWGTWCPPCRTEMPEMQKMYEKYKGRVQIVGISMGPRDQPDMAREFVEGRGFEWTFVHDEDYKVASQYSIQSVPTSFFIDKDGVVSAIHIGAMTGPQIDGYLRHILTP
ncbi:MAG TPA: TlpA disulfide reductase family protein [Chloroflexia bacterium]|nr:TlpA disulfide reductase family protein [Chloroflexia bacterium]